MVSFVYTDLSLDGIITITCLRHSGQFFFQIVSPSWLTCVYTSLSGECIRASVKNNDGFKTLFGCGAITASLLMEICRVIYYSSSAHCKESLLGEQAYIVGAFFIAEQ